MRAPIGPIDRSEGDGVCAPRSRTVDDPELPGVSIVELGLLEDVAASTGARVEVDLVPTFSGCPALVDDRDRRAGAQSVRSTASATSTCVLRGQPVWTPERITERARAQLRRRSASPSSRPGAGDVPPLRCRGARRAVAVRSDALPVDRSAARSAARPSRRFADEGVRGLPEARGQGGVPPRRQPRGRRRRAGGRAGPRDLRPPRRGRPDVARRPRRTSSSATRSSSRPNADKPHRHNDGSLVAEQRRAAAGRDVSGP